MSLASRLKSGEIIYSGWSHLTDPFAMEALARTPLDAVLFDMQHGPHDTGASPRSPGSCAAHKSMRWCAFRSVVSTWRAVRWISVSKASSRR